LSRVVQSTKACHTSIRLLAEANISKNIEILDIEERSKPLLGDEMEAFPEIIVNAA
jgi:hypothetical protein